MVTFPFYIYFTVSEIIRLYRKRKTTLPYVKGVSERVRKVLSRVNIKTAFQPVKTLAHYFIRKTKTAQMRSKGKELFTKFKCRCCDFTYVEEIKRSWNSRGSEHKPGTRNNRESVFKDHAETTTDCDICVNYIQILE